MVLTWAGPSGAGPERQPACENKERKAGPRGPAFANVLVRALPGSLDQMS